MSSSAPITINPSTTTLAVSPDPSINSSVCTSPISPPSPSQYAASAESSPSQYAHFHFLNRDYITHGCNVQRSMLQSGYIPLECITPTLQGSLWKVKSVKTKEMLVIKVAQKSLYKKSVAVVNGNEIKIKEDILKETAVLRYLSCSESHPPHTLAKFESFFSDEKNYFLVMQFGGTPLFEFVQTCHQYISAGQITINEWQKFCKRAFRQMIELIDWMQNKMNCCHLDISLENFVIHNPVVIIDRKTNHIRFTNDFVIRIVDFGLAEVFTSKTISGDVDYQCNKYVGKTAYKAPKVYAQRAFDARAADIWSLGAVLFMMLIGRSLYQKPCNSDAVFRYITSGNIIELLDFWEQCHYVTVPIVDLMHRIFVQEKYRLNIKDIKNHPWLL